MKFRYNPVLEQPVYVGSSLEMVREDVTCECMCPVREEHCDEDMHYYDDVNCRCFKPLTCSLLLLLSRDVRTGVAVLTNTWLTTVQL